MKLDSTSAWEIFWVLFGVLLLVASPRLVLEILKRLV
jgi:hypothetical protein